MNNAKLHGIVECIKGRREFPFDVEDVEDNLTEVLSSFNVFEVLTNEEAGVLKADLTKLALQAEEAEAVRLALRMGWIREEDICPVGDKDDDDE